MRSYVLLVSLVSLVACPTFDPGADTGATTSETYGSPTTDGLVDLNPYMLGDHSSQACLDAMAHAGEFLAATAAGDAAAATSAYADPLRGYVQALDTAHGRADDPAIVDALAQGDPSGAALAEGRLHAALSAHLRANLAAVATDTADKYTAWDEAHCVWTDGLRPLAERVDANPVLGGFPTTSIDNFFLFGHTAIAGEPPMTTLDPWDGPEFIQRIETTLLRAAHHDLVIQAHHARTEGDATAAARARGVLEIVRDQIEGRNTPGLAAIEAMLAGDPLLVETEFILFGLDIAFAKHARDAIDQTSTAGFGTPVGHGHAVAGLGYTQIVEPGMLADLPGLDTYPHFLDWDKYIDLARSGDDDDDALAVGQNLIDFNCAYQTALGVAACTGTTDEP